MLWIRRFCIASTFSICLALVACGNQDDQVPNPDEDGLDNQPSGSVVVESSYSFVPVSQLPSIPEMPDPLIMYDGTEVLTEEQWQVRRQEMIRILEDYEYGHMPPAPGNVTSEVTSPEELVTAADGTQATYQKIHLSFGVDDSLGFDLGLFTPLGASAGAPGSYPTLINLTFSSGKTSLGSAKDFLARGYAVVSVAYSQFGADNTNYLNTAFFPAYPEYDWRDFSAWAWGLSRVVDYLTINPVIDADKIIITGVSRLAQAVLLAGALDERIAMSAPVAGGMALRYSGREMGQGLGQGITEVVDQNTYWFGPLFEKFRNKTPYLPCDQHWLLALTAPRLFIMSNSLQDPYGRAQAAAQTYLHAKPVYEFLGADSNLGVHFREGGHGANAEDWKAILDFADQYLLEQDRSRDFSVLPEASKLP